jgi:hypothetical protein
MRVTFNILRPWQHRQFRICRVNGKRPILLVSCYQTLGYLRKSPLAEGLVKTHENNCNGKVIRTWFQVDIWLLRNSANVISDGFHLWRNVITVASIYNLTSFEFQEYSPFPSQPLEIDVNWMDPLDWMANSILFQIISRKLHVMLDQPIKSFCQNPGKTSFWRYNRYRAALPDSRSCKSRWRVRVWVERD